MAAEEQMELRLIRQMDKNDELLRKSYDKLQKRYPNRLIAIEGGKVVASSTNIKSIEQKLAKLGKEAAPVLIRYIPPAGMAILY